MQYKAFAFTFIAFWLSIVSTFGQVLPPGTLDTTLNFGVQHRVFTNGDPSPGAGASFVFCTKEQLDGKLLIGGSFTTYNGAPRPRIARLNANGTLDTTFQPGSGANEAVYAIDVQTDGKIIIAGNFTSVNGVSRNRIARLHVDGSLDTSFVPALGPNNIVHAIALQTDSQILIAGAFTSYNGSTVNRIVRLRANGDIDSTFITGSRANNTILQIILQPDGKPIIAGDFTLFNGTSRNRIARLNIDGSVDLTFNPGSGPNNTISGIALQTDGKILVGGLFSSFNGISRMRLARLEATGNVDNTFIPSIGSTGAPSCFAIQSDGKIIVAGSFFVINNIVTPVVVRINATGSLDTTYQIPQLNGDVTSITIEQSGKAILNGSFTLYNNVRRVGIARALEDGNLDDSFNPIPGANGSILTFARQADGKMVIAGTFTEINGRKYSRIARLQADGNIDPNFMIGAGVNFGDIQASAIQSDGKILLGGNFTGFNNINRNRIVRLNPDGSVDTTFIIGNGPNNAVNAIAIQSDGKILLGGAFFSFSGTPVGRLIRLLPDGTLDTSFNIGTGVDGSVSTIAIQPDGKMLIGGSFSAINGVWRNNIARLNANGSVDMTFSPTTGVSVGANNLIRHIHLQSDGKLIISGMFTSYNGTSRNRIARVNANGSLDASFNPGSGANASVMSSVTLANGKVLLTGQFTSYNGSAVNRFACLNDNGSLDATFQLGSGLNGWGNCFDVLPNGTVVVSGTFTSYNGISRNAIMRLHASICSTSTVNNTNASNICVGSSKNLIGTPGGTWIIAAGPGSIVGSTYLANGGSGSVSIFNLIGNCASPMVVFNVDSLPIAPNVPAPTSICSGDSAVIVPSGAVRFRFYSSATGGLPLPGGDLVTTYTTPILTSTTTYYVSALNLAGCESTSRTAVTVSVSSLPAAPSVPPIPDQCVGDSVTLTPIGGGTFNFYADSTSVNPLPNGSNVFSFTTPALDSSISIYVSSLNSLGCESGTRTVVGIIVHPTPTVTIFQRSDTLFAQGSVGGYQWYRDSTAIVGATNSYYVPTQNGVYKVVLLSPAGCEGNSNEITVMSVGIGFDFQSETPNWIVFPVPFSNELNIQADGIFEYKLFDSRGLNVLSGKCFETELRVSTNQLSSGVYYMQLFQNGLSSTRKLVKL
jgi:uncharacterized delta-60 repeat protein